MNVINKTTARLILLVAVLLFGVSNMSYGIIAYPEPVVVVLPDGSQVTIRVHGDEFFNYTTTSDGYIVARSADGYLHYADYDSGKLRVSSSRVGKSSAFGKAKSIPENVKRTLRADGLKALHTPAKTNRGSGVYSSGKAEHPTKGIILLVEYSDVKFVTPNPRQSFDNMSNQAGYSENGAVGSIADYYDANSMEVYRPDFDVFGPYELPNTMSYYAANNSANRGDEQVKDAVMAAMEDPSVDFSKYASDGTTVDLLLLYYAGHNAAEGGNGVWPHMFNVSKHNLTPNGVKINTYACTSELRGAYGANMAGIGTMCHEFGHALGLADVYSVNNKNNLAVKSWGDTDVMNSGGYNNLGKTPPLFTAYERETMGWLTLEDIESSGDYTLDPLFTSNKAYRIKTDVEGEYYTLENRNTGSGNKWDAPIGATAKGMVAFHMDYSENRFYSSFFNQYLSAELAWNSNVPNSTPEHLCADFVEASGTESSSQRLSTLFFPGSDNVTSLGSSAVKAPRLATWSNINLGVDLTDIKISGDQVTFTVKRLNVDYTKAQLTGYIKSVMNLPMNGAVVNVYDATAGSSSTPLFSATTDEKGAYSIINLDVDKNYLVVATSAPLYLPSESTRTFTKGTNTIDLSLSMAEDNPDKNIIKWYGSEDGTKVHDSSGDLYARIKFSAADLLNFEKSRIYSVYVMTDNTATYATLSITSNKIDLVKNLRVDQSGGGKIIFDLSKLNIVKKNSEELIVTIKTNGKILIDETVVVKGKSNLMSTDGLDWREMSYYPPAYIASWIIGINLNEGGGEVVETAPFPAIKLAASYVVGDKFTPALNNATSDVESVTYSVNGTKITGEYTFTAKGEHTITAEIKYSDASALGTETIVRKITVQ